MAETPVFPGDPARPGAPLPSLRDYFAAQAMAAMNENLSVEEIVVKSYELADAMLVERSRDLIEQMAQHLCAWVGEEDWNAPGVRERYIEGTREIFRGGSHLDIFE
jgi:hypothetical protein